MTPEERRRRRTVLLWALGAAAGIGGIAFFAGLALPLSALLAGTVVALGSVATLLAAPRDERWPESRVVLRSGARREVARLSWSMVDDDGRVADAAVQRLRVHAAARLAERGIDLADAADRQAAESALGAAEYRLLTEPGRHRPAALIRCARAIERLERLDRREAAPAGGGPASPKPLPRRTA